MRASPPNTITWIGERQKHPVHSTCPLLPLFMEISRTPGLTDCIHDNSRSEEKEARELWTLARPSHSHSKNS